MKYLLTFTSGVVVATFGFYLVMTGTDIKHAAILFLANGHSVIINAELDEGPDHRALVCITDNSLISHNLIGQVLIRMAGDQCAEARVPQSADPKEL